MVYSCVKWNLLTLQSRNIFRKKYYKMCIFSSDITRKRYFNNYFQLDFWLVDWVYKPFLFFTIEWHLSGVWVCYNIIKKNTLMGLTYMMRPLRNNFLARICLSKRNIISWIREYTGNKHLYHCQCITILCSFLDRHFNVRYSKYLHY